MYCLLALGWIWSTSLTDEHLGFHEETGDECFDWYTAEELQRNCIVSSLKTVFPDLTAHDTSSVYRVLDIGAGTSGTTMASFHLDCRVLITNLCLTTDMLFNLYEKLSEEVEQAATPFRIEIWGVDFSRTVRVSRLLCPHPLLL